MAADSAPNPTVARHRACAPSRYALPLFAAWTILVVCFYYRRAGRLLIAGPHAWELQHAWHQALPTLVLVALATAGLTVWWLSVRFRRQLVARGPSLLALACATLFLALTVASRAHFAGRWLPWAGEACQRALLATGAAAVVGFDAFLLGLALLSALGLRASLLERALLAFALGFAALSYILLACAAAGLYRPEPVRAALATIALAGAVWMIARVKRRPASPSARSSRASAVAHADTLWVVVCASALLMAFVTALAPETEYDALWYHLWLPQMWLQHGGPVNMPSEYISLYPLTWELLFGAGLATGGPVAAKLLHFACLPLCGAAVWQFARRFFPRSSPWLSAAIFLTVPTVLWEATTAYIDLALAFYATVGLYALLAFTQTRSATARETVPIVKPSAWLAAAAICLAMAAGIKHLGLIVLCVAACLAIIGNLRRGDGVRGLVPALVLVGAAMLLALPWYWRAWHATGNPFFPELSTVFGAPAAWWDHDAQQGLDRFKAHFGFPRTPLNLVALPWNVTMHTALFGGGFGPVFLIALPLVVAWRRSSPAARHLLLFVVGYLALWASPVSSFQFRFLVPVIPLLAVLSGATLAALSHALRPDLPLSPAAAVVTALLVLNLPPFTPLHEGDRTGWTGWMTHVVRTVPLNVVVGREAADDYLRQRVATYGAWQYARGHVPSTATVLEFGGGDNFYASRERLSMDARAARDAWASGPAASAIVERCLHDLGASYVLFDRRRLNDLERSQRAIASPAFRQTALALVYEDEGALLYRVEPKTGSAAPSPTFSGRSGGPSTARR